LSKYISVAFNFEFRGHPSKTSGPMGGGGQAKVATVDGGGRGRHLSRTSISDDF